MKKVAVIGSGFAGLISAVLLAKKGYEVTIFEQHYRIGGYGDCFHRKGFRFHTSVYRVPRKWSKLLELADISFSEDEKFAGQCQYIFADGNTIVPGGNLEEKIIALYPEKALEISSFFEDMDQAGETFGKIYEAGYSMKNLSIQEVKSYVELSNLTIGDVLASYFGQDNGIKEVIKATLDFDDDTIALVIPVTLKEIKVDEEDQLPYGGAPSIIKRLIKELRQYGGTIHLSEGVKKLSINDDGYCISLITTKKTYCEFDEILMAADINYFYTDLLSKPINHEYKEQNFAISNSTFSLWLGLDCCYESLQLPKETIYYYIDQKDWYLKSVGAELELSSDYLFISTLFSKDPLSTKQGKSQLCIGLSTQFSPFFNAKLSGRYEQMKLELSEKLINIVSDLIPHIKSLIIVQESASPVTYYDYTKNTNGATIGYQKRKNFIMSKKRHKNINVKLKNIAFGSQWTSILGGVIGSMEEGVKAANVILKKDKLGSYDYMEKLM